MGPKYEFTNEIAHTVDGSTLHRIKRLSDNKLGGFIEKESNLSQKGNCWVDNNAIVCGNAHVYGNAQVCDNAFIYHNAKVSGNAKVCDNAVVCNNARVYDNVKVFDEAEVFGNAIVYGNAKIYGHAKIYGDAKIYGNFDLSWGVIDRGEYTGNKEEYTSNKEGSSKEIVQDFIYKVDDSNKITAQTEYDSIEEFFSESVANDIKLDTLVICTVDTKEPIIKLQKVNNDSDKAFKYIVEITSEKGDDFIVRSIIKTQEQLNQLIQQTIEALKQYPQFSKYADTLEECL